MLGLELLFVDDVLKLALLRLHCRNVYNVHMRQVEQNSRHILYYIMTLHRYIL